VTRPSTPSADSPTLTGRRAGRTRVGNVPTTIDDDARADLRRHFSVKDAEWLVLAVAMMGFLNKAMDASGSTRGPGGRRGQPG